ncbi:MAG: pyridoxal-phosphate dependent enzyme, partial [Candidatus Thorarchaeota archaeon]
MSFQGITEAYKRISGIANKTPVMSSRTLNSILKAEIHHKCENFQRAGAFKFRGAYNALSLLTKEEKQKGVVTHSSGNHAQAVALAASILGIHTKIVMP